MGLAGKELSRDIFQSFMVCIVVNDFNQSIFRLIVYIMVADIIYLNAKVSQPFNICIFFSMVHVRRLI